LQIAIEWVLDMIYFQKILTDELYKFTIGIKTLEWPTKLKHVIKSIRRFYLLLKIIVVDDNTFSLKGCLMSYGKLVISLDVELFWGVRDSKTIAEYGTNIKNEQHIIPRILKIFSKYNIHATWATVGLLFCKNKEEIFKFAPSQKPCYTNTKLNPYIAIATIGTNKDDDPYHYASDLIHLIKDTPHQEIATHTFSHYYCLESGQTVEDFDHDLTAAVKVADKNGIKFSSIVFPRNQYATDYLQICLDHGIHIYRGNQSHWAYATHNVQANTNFKRIYRLIDSYVNISGHHTYTPNYDQNLINVPASKFLRPFSNKLKLLESLKLRRIYKSMEHAAKNGQVYHLWWHPHNFGSNIEQNFAQLEKILDHYTQLNKKYNMNSVSMKECSKIYKKI
jgi:peptidoglycan/xylan/chitin deacetylase (PgdA/CDA1 family)